MLNPTYLGKSGYCVPQSCRTNRECPTVGDECGDGSISGTCKAGNCQYDPVLAAADCGNNIFWFEWTPKYFFQAFIHKISNMVTQLYWRLYFVKVLMSYDIISGLKVITLLCYSTTPSLLHH